MSSYYVERRGVLASETVVRRDRLAELERKAAVVDAYEAAAREMRNRQGAMLARPQRDEYATGYLDALREFAELVVRHGSGE